MFILLVKETTLWYIYNVICVITKVLHAIHKQ